MDVEAMWASVGVGVTVGGVLAFLAVIRREVSEAGGDLRIAFVWTTRRLENLCPTVGGRAVGRLEDCVSAAEFNRWMQEEVVFVVVDPAVVVEVECAEAFVDVPVISFCSVDGVVVHEEVPKLTLVEMSIVILIDFPKGIGWGNTNTFHFQDEALPAFLTPLVLISCLHSDCEAKG